MPAVPRIVQGNAHLSMHIGALLGFGQRTLLMVATEEESRDRLAAIARMYYLDNLGQQEIAGILGLSRSQISRLLTRAREQGIVRVSVDDYDPRDHELETQLVERYGLRRAFVVRTGDRGSGQIRAAIGYFAAPAVGELIRPGMTLGLAGGRTLAALVGQLKPGPGVRGVTVVQLMGNIGPAASEIDAVDLSRTLAQRFGGAFYTVNAPAIAQDTPARDHFLAHDHIRFVWDLFPALQMAFVGIGTLEESAFIERGVLTRAELAKLSRAGAVGEICGRFFDASGRECQSAYRDRVISIELDALRRCPEVVAVTTGPRRAAAVRAALAGGLVNSLVIDEVGARALLGEGDSRERR
jgi:deoxyribonucleoside regulator